MHKHIPGGIKAYILKGKFKTLRGKHRELLNIGNYVSKGIHQREEVLKYDYIEILHFYTNKDTISKGKIQAVD